MTVGRQEKGAPETVVSCTFKANLHFTIHRCVPTEAGAAAQGAEADVQRFTQRCTRVSRKCTGENPAYASWAERNAHALRAKSETSKRGNDFHRGDSVFLILIYLIYWVFLFLS